MLVIVAGIFSLILFAAVLGTTGYVLMAIFDDFVGRLWFSAPLKKPGVGVLVWGIVWLAYARSVAQDVRFWWDRRLPEFGADVGGWDALWFAYISTTTIGLGDYFLQPELMFASDALKYSVLFMVGFVFFSSFLNKLAGSIAWMLPKNSESLESRLKATRALACWRRGLLPWEQATQDDHLSQRQESDELSFEDDKTNQRIQLLKSMLAGNDTGSNEKKESSTNEVARSNLDGSSTSELIEEEEAVLLQLLAKVREQKGRAMSNLESTSRPPSPPNMSTSDVEGEGSVVFEA